MTWTRGGVVVEVQPSPWGTAFAVDVWRWRDVRRVRDTGGGRLGEARRAGFDVCLGGWRVRIGQRVRDARRFHLGGFVEGALVGFFAGGVDADVVGGGAMGAVGWGAPVRADFVQVDRLARPFGHDWRRGLGEVQGVDHRCYDGESKRHEEDGKQNDRTGALTQNGRQAIRVLVKNAPEPCDKKSRWRSRSRELRKVASS